MPAASVGGETSPTPKFSDFVAILNPLQNLPIVGTVYRKLTGDEPHPAARVLGGLLWGGPLGLVGAALTYIAEQVSGKSATDLVKSIFDGSEKTAPAVADGAVPAAEPGATPEAASPAATPLPASAEVAAPARAEAVPAAAKATPPITPSPQDQQGAIAPARPRNAATRDLPFYQAHAGSRLPAASSAPAASGPQSAPQLPMFHRPVTPVFGPEPSTAVAQPARAPASPARADLPVPAKTPDPTSPDFAQRMLQGLERYRAITLANETKTPVLDRVE